MSLRENKKIIEAFIEIIWNQYDLTRINEFIDSSYKISGLGKGTDAVRKNVQNFHEAFPDLKISITNLVAENDTVVAWMEFEGTQKGQFKCYPPSEKFVKWWEVGLWRLKNKKIVFGKSRADRLGIRRGIGVIPPLPEDK